MHIILYYIILYYIYGLYGPPTLSPSLSPEAEGAAVTRPAVVSGACVRVCACVRACARVRASVPRTAGNSRAFAGSVSEGD